jgi:ABC-type branched-subunit amino acid transport system ATPase component
MSAFFEVSNLSVSFGGVAALQDVNLHADEAELLGLIGPNGAGKTTVLNCISGVLTQSSGSIRMDGKLLSGQRPHRIARMGVARTFQAVEHFKQFTVLQYVMLGRLRHYRQAVAEFGLGLPWAVRRERQQLRQAMHFIEKYGLAEINDRRLSELPYGLQKLADIVRAIAVEPQLLLLDEPAAGSSESERTQLRRMVAELRNEGCTVILVDHDVAFVSDSCDRIAAMDAGQKLVDGPPHQVLAHQSVIASYLGAAAVR